MSKQKIVTRMGKGGVMTPPLGFNYFLLVFQRFFLVLNESSLRILHSAEKKIKKNKFGTSYGLLSAAMTSLSPISP